MKLGIMQPYFMPYLGYWQLIKAVDKFVIYDDVNFIKGGWINRNNILLNNQRFLINLLLSGASSNKLINEIKVQGNQTKLIKTIESAYKKAPMFDTVFPLFLQIMSFCNNNLAKFIGNSLIEVTNYLMIETEFIYSSDIEKDNSLRAQDKILHICNLLGAKQYINAIGGQELYDKESFDSQGLKLNFIKSELPPYKQFNNEFIPGLSIIDVMMFNSVEEINGMLDKYELI
ncbi:MAG TPA: WbqC family protein [Clostridiales bacterium]|nr:WbqC family protein [Clostridiales bacterium]